MTMPRERTRSLRFGWEFLIELQAADNLSPNQRTTIDAILRHYPSPPEIAAWAASDSLISHALGPSLEPETSAGAVPAAILLEHGKVSERGPTSLSERTKALRDARQFFKSLQSAATNLTPEQRRQIPYVLRHYPDAFELPSWTEAERIRENQGHGH